MSLFDARAARVLATLALYALGLMFVVLAWRTLVTFLFAVMFAYLLEPAVRGMQRRMKLHRGAAVALLYALILSGLGAFFFTAGPGIGRQVAHLSAIAPDLPARLASGQIAREIGSQRGWSAETQSRLQQLLVQNRVEIAAWSETLVRDLGGVAANAAWLGLVPILAVFFLLAEDRFSNALLQQFGRPHQRLLLAGLLNEVHDVFAGYIRSQIFLTTLAVAVYLAGFELLRLPYAVSLAVGAGLLEFIPVVGPLLGAALVLVVSFMAGYPHLWAVMVFLGAWRVQQDYVNAPKIMGNQVQLHPLAVLFGVLAGGEIAGVIGVYLSVPVLATLRAVWRRWRALQTQQAAETPEATGGG